MDIGFTSDQELAAAQLRTIAPLVKLSRKSFVALNLLQSFTPGTIEAAAWNSSLSAAKAVLMLEHELKSVISRS